MTQHMETFGTKERYSILAVNYLVKGLPSSLINGGTSKSTISPIISASADKEKLLLITKAVLSLEFSEEDYMKRLQLESTSDGIYSKMKQVLLGYR